MAHIKTKSSSQSHQRSSRNQELDGGQMLSDIDCHGHECHASVMPLSSETFFRSCQATLCHKHDYKSPFSAASYYQHQYSERLDLKKRGFIFLQMKNWTSFVHSNNLLTTFQSGSVRSSGRRSVPSRALAALLPPYRPRTWPRPYLQVTKPANGVPWSNHQATLYRPATRLRPPRIRELALFNSRRYLMSWQGRGSSPVSEDGLSDGHEEAARAAILEKALKGRQPTDLLLRCTILDANGNVKTISGRFKKSDLCTEHRLNPRDLRKIDVPNLVPTILVRKEAILVNVLHIRAMVKADCVILFDTYGSTETRLHSIFLYHLEHNLRTKGNSGLPYEFRALESILLSVFSALESEMVFTRHLVGGLLAELEDDIDRDKFKKLLHHSRRLTAFQNRAKLVQESIDEVLEQDEDLAAMYLSDKKAGTPRNLSDHEELEVLLESFSKQVEEIVNESETTITNVQSTQEIVELILDSNRNALLALDLKVSIATMGIGTGALIASFFGMNLLSHLEEHPWAFPVVSGLAVLASAGIALIGFRTLAKIRRVGLSSSKSGNARSISGRRRNNLTNLKWSDRDGWLSQ